MQEKRMEDLLKLTADMQSFYAENDALTARIRSCEDDELSADELELVSAAAAEPDYRKFLELTKHRR